MGAELPIGPDAGITIEEFLAYCETRPGDERWQLLEGLAIMMTPPNITHHRIQRNFLMLLLASLEASGSALTAYDEIGVKIPGEPTFLPIADIAVIDDGLTDVTYPPRIYLTAEVLSPSNTAYEIGLKRTHYAKHPDNLYNIVFAHDAPRAELAARADGWISRIVEGPEAWLDLPEFGLSARLRDIYRGTGVAGI